MKKRVPQSKSASILCHTPATPFVCVGDFDYMPLPSRGYAGWNVSQRKIAGNEFCNSCSTAAVVGSNLDEAVQCSNERPNTDTLVCVREREGRQSNISHR